VLPSKTKLPQSFEFTSLAELNKIAGPFKFKDPLAFTGRISLPLDAIFIIPFY
jgi:hypothetical protein